MKLAQPIMGRRCLGKLLGLRPYLEFLLHVCCRNVVCHHVSRVCIAKDDAEQEDYSNERNVDGSQNSATRFFKVYSFQYMNETACFPCSGQVSWHSFSPPSAPSSSISCQGTGSFLQQLPSHQWKSVAALKMGIRRCVSQMQKLLSGRRMVKIWPLLRMTFGSRTRRKRRRRSRRKNRWRRHGPTRKRCMLRMEGGQ